MQGCCSYAFDAFNSIIENIQHLPRLAASIAETQSSMIIDFYENNETIAYIAKAINDLALPVFAAVTCAVLFPSYSTIICIGFLIPIVAPKSVQDLCTRINLTWERASVILKSVIVTAGVIAFPFSIPVFALSLGMYFGYKIQPAENFV